MKTLTWMEKRAYELGVEAAQSWLAMMPEQRNQKRNDDILPPSLSSWMDEQEQHMFRIGYNYTLSKELGK